MTEDIYTRLSLSLALSQSVREISLTQKQPFRCGASSLTPIKVAGVANGTGIEIKKALPKREGFGFLFAKTRWFDIISYPFICNISGRMIKMVYIGPELS
jgi:hypothetical protein